MYNVKQNKNNSRIFTKNFVDFQNVQKFTKLKTFKTHLFFIYIIHKPSLWWRDVPQKIWARSVQPFWRLLDTNRQTGLTRARKTSIRFLRFKNHVLVCNNLETELSIYTFSFNRICQQKRIKKGGIIFYLICQIVIKLWSAVLWDKDQTVISAWDNVFLVQMPNAIKKYISELNFS